MTKLGKGGKRQKLHSVSKIALKAKKLKKNECKIELWMDECLAMIALFAEEK